MQFVIEIHEKGADEARHYRKTVVHLRMAAGLAANGLSDLFDALEAVADIFARDTIGIPIGAPVTAAPQFHGFLAG